MAQQVEIANAYIALTTKMPGVKKEISQALGGAQSQVQKSGGSLGTSLMKGMKVTAIAGAAAVGAAAAGAIGIALTKGFQRLNGIDQATAKMKGLGFSAKETEGLMDNALTSVQGTAFGLDEAATVASQLAATGIGPGEEMAGILTTVANNAAAAGSSMDEMGSIFSKAASQANGIQNDILAQLADKGIPIYQALGEQMGVTAGEVFDLASAGEIGFADFEAAAESAAGGVAEAMGDTVTGSWSNFTASLGRAGAGLLGGVFEQLAPALQGITDAFGPLEDVAADVGGAIGDFLRPGLEFLANLGDSGIDFSAFGQLGTIFSPVALAFQTIGPILPTLIESFSQMAAMLGEALQPVLDALLPLLSQVAAILVETLIQMLPILTPIIETVAEVLASIFTAIAPLLPVLGDLIEALLPGIGKAFEVFMPIVQGVVDMIGTALVPVINLVADVLGGLMTFLTGVFTGDWEMAWQGIVDIAAGIWNGLIGIVEGTINGVVDLINGMINHVNEITGTIGIPSIPNIPHVSLGAAFLAEGGVVQRSQGGTLAVIGEGRYDEAVLPLSPQVLSQLGGSGGGARIEQNVYPAPGMDETEIARVAANQMAFSLRGA